MSHLSNFTIEENKDLIHEFIKKNNITILDELYLLINSNLTLTTKPKLELSELTKEWKTIFIKLEVSNSFEMISDFHIKFMDKLFEYPSMMEFINIDITPILSEPILTNWNELSLDQMVDFLKEKHQFSSTGETKCILSLIDFYEKNKTPKSISNKQIRSILELACYEDSNHDVWGQDTYLGTMDDLIKKANQIIAT